MDLLNIKKQLAANLGGETATDLHSEEDRLRAINQAYKQITEDYEIGQGTLPASLPPGQSTLAIPGQSVMISADGITTQTDKLIQIGYEELIKMRGEYPSQTGTPSYWAIDSSRNGSVIEFFPTPTASTLVRINYIADSSELTADSDQPWGGRYERYHDLIPVLAASRMYREKGITPEDMQVSRFWLSEYQREAEKLGRTRKREHGGRTVLSLGVGTRSGKRDWRDE